MAATDPVRIVVEIVDEFSDDLAELRAQLEELDLKDLDINLDVDDNGDIESVKAQLQALREGIEAHFDIDIDDSDFARAMGMKALLDDDVEMGVDFEPNRDDLPIPGDAETLQGLKGVGPDDIRTPNAAEVDFMRNIREATDSAAELESDLDTKMRGQFDSPRALEVGSTGFGDFLGRERGTDAFQRMFGGDADFEVPGFGDGDDRDRFPRFRRMLGSPGIDAFGGSLLPGTPDMPFSRRAGAGVAVLNDEFNNLGRTLLKYRPSIMDWWNIMAALIPILIAMIGLVIGLASAFVALGLAAATLAGVGLLGWGDSISESFSKAQSEAKRLARTLFDVMQPAADAFQPLQEDAMRAIPGLVADLVGPMQNLTVFADEIAGIGTGFVDWIERGINAAVGLDDVIGQILTRFGAGLGDFLIGVLRTMTKEVYRNQNAYADLAAILVESLVIIFNVVKAVAFTISQFRFLIDIIALLTNLMSNKWAVGFLTFISIVVLLETALATLVQTLYALAGVGLISWLRSLFPFLSMLIGYIQAATLAIWEMYGAWAALAAATGVGLALAAGGLLLEDVISQSVNNPGGGARGAAATRGGGTYINIEGDVEKKQMDRLLDKVPGETRGEMQMQDGIEGP